MEYPFLVFIHLAFAVLWAGGAITVGLFIIPSVFEAGPAAGAVMGGVTRRKFPILMTASGFVVVLTGLRLYMLRFSGDWLTSPEGIVLSLGAVLGIGALAIGLFVQKPTVERLARLGAEVAASGSAPSPAQAAEMQTLRTRLLKVGRILAFHLLAATLLMSVHRLAAML